MPYSSGTFSRVHDFTSDRDAGIKIQASRTDAEFDGIATALSTAILKDGTQTTTATVPFAFGISIVDNKAITLGTNSDITIQYDETTNDSLEIAAAVEGAALGIVFKSDQGDDNADQHKLSIADGGTLTLASKISGSFVTYLTHTPNSTVASSTLAVAGNLTVGGNLTLGSGAVLSEAELEQLDGITAGTVTASKAVVVDANKDIASFRNITLTGELDAGSLDVSGDADIDGTLEADAITVDGTALTEVISDTTGAMFSSNTETGITVTYQDADNTIDVEIDAAQTAITSVVNTSLEIGRDADNRIKFGTDNQIIFEVDGGDNVIFKTSGEIEASSLDISGDADIDGTLEADAITVAGTALNTVIAGVTVTNATNSAHVLVTDNESQNEENLITFVEDATTSTGNVGLEMDGNLTYNPSTGTVTATVFKGNIDAVDGDFDGTLEADAMTLNGTAITTTATLSTGISNGNVLVANASVADNDFLRVDGTSIEGRSASEVLSDIGGQASLTFGISNTNAVKIDSASVADDEFARFTANGLESRSAAETLSDIGASPVAGSSSIVTTGALNDGSITSGFGAIDNGSSNITTTGVGSFGSLDISGNIDVDGTTNLDAVDIDGALTQDGGTVFNEAGADVDFRIESNGKANMFFVDGGNDSVIIGHNAKIAAVGSLDANLQLVSGDAQPSLDIVCFSDNANHRGQITFSKSASDTIGTGAVVGTSDLVGDIVWGVHDGTDFANEIAFIRGAMDSAGVGANDTGGMLQFGTSSDGNNSGTERMRIAEDGDVFIGVTALPSSSTGGAGFQVASNNRNVLYLATSVSSNTSLAVFINSNGQVGGIKTSGSATAFNTSSDYRLKENVNYSWDATTRLKQLKPARFNFKADPDVTVDGFLAHEVSSIVPEAISGEKDETQNVGTVKNKDGKILYENVEEYKADIDKEQTWTKTGTEDVYQQIDQSKLVPLLVKTIQELEARVTALESA